MKLKKYWFQILAWGLCFIIAYELYYIVSEDNRKYAERVVQIQQQASDMEKTDREKSEALVDIYDKLYSQIKVPEFICWGDSAMAGSRESSLPISLETVISDNVFSPLSQTFSQVLDSEEYSLPSVLINNMGVTNEGMRQILVRAGVNIMDLGEGIEIPSETDPVSVRLMDEEAWNSEKKDAELKFTKQRDVGFGKVIISDIEGSLITTDDWFDATHPRYAFIREDEGDWMRVGSGTEIEIETATKYIGDIPIFFFENDSGRSVDGFVSDIEKLVKRYAGQENEDDLDEEDEERDIDDIIDGEQSAYNLPYVVICTTTEASSLDKALSEKFGSHYIRNDKLAVEMTDRNFKKLAQLVYENLDEQGCFTDVHAIIALAIEEANDL